MKATCFFWIYFSCFLSSFAQLTYEDYFMNQQMRVDIILAGNRDSSSVYLDKIKMEPQWGGSHVNLIDTFDYGGYKFEVYSQKDGKLIYSRGFSTLFDEWQTTEEARHVARSFQNTLVFPYPIDEVNLLLYKRNRQNTWNKVFSFTVNPSDILIIKDSPFPYKTKAIHASGSPDKKLDIVIVAEGYTEKEVKKFFSDAANLSSYFLKHNPFSEYSKLINIHAVASVSQESGTDKPEANLWKKTVMNTHFSTFYLERYIMTNDYYSVRDVASLVPYDQIVVLVNTDKYGGGAIYNFYSVFTSDNAVSKVVFVHEFGHSFAGLADEYYDSEVAYQDFYNKSVEPWEPNITTLVDFSSKWKNMVADTLPVPTPDSVIYHNSVGVFEGAGYSAKGIYRPYYNCRMKSNSVNYFCPVCERAIINMLKFYAE